MAALSIAPRQVRTPVLFQLLLTFVLALLSVVSYPQLQPEIPLLYSLAQPSDQLVSKEWIFFFPVTAAIISMIHLSIVQLGRHYSALLLRLFAWTTVMVLALLTIIFIRLLWII